LFALGVTWAARRRAGPGSRVVQLSSDRSFGVFLVHPMVLWVLTLGPAAWLSTRVSALSVTVIAFVTTIVVSLLVVEALRHSPLGLALTGKPGSPRGRADHCTRVESSVSTPPIRLGAGRT
jgi:hypothetical protein